MIKCRDCGLVFDDNELVSVTEPHGETHSACPSCECDDFEDLQRCEYCGEWFSDDELIGELCEACLGEIMDEYRCNPKGCYELSKDETQKVELNLFLTSIFSKEDIEAILLELVEEMSVADKLEHCSNFVTEDRWWFAENAMRRKEC